MCTRPSSSAQALAMVRDGLSFLAAGSDGEVLAGLEQAEARLVAARAAALSRFCAVRGFEADGQFGPKPWLRAFTRVTKGAAAAAMAWMHRLRAHPLIADALAAAQISPSWARELCTWTDRLPPGPAQDADQILLAAAAAGADLPDLALLWEEILARAAVPDEDDGTFADRSLWLDPTLAGAGRLTGDLTPACAAALSAVLDALGGKAGPEDTRSATQRRHDALEEACQRLIAAGMLPGRDGQPLRVYAHLDLAALAGLPAPATPGLPAPATAGLPAPATAGPDADAAACDATVIPVVTGNPDWSLADELIGLALPARAPAAGAPPPGPAGAPPPGPAGPITSAGLQRLRQLVAGHATALLSGPAGLAAQLRTQTLGHPLSGPSQPLDIGAATPLIPPHLRRAVSLRDRHCRFPGCTQPPAVCQVHHLKPRARGGATALTNLALLCRFHHLVVIHRWHWTLTCHPDGTTTAVSPDGHTLHGHSPPRQASAA